MNFPSSCDIPEHVHDEKTDTNLLIITSMKNDNTHPTQQDVVVFHLSALLHL